MTMNERIPNDPQYADAAEKIAAQHHSQPLGWRVQEDGTLTVALVSGPKVNAAPLGKARPARLTIIDTYDGVDPAEASAAGAALAQAKKPPKGGKKQ
jgi:hypothetical protein